MEIDSEVVKKSIKLIKRTTTDTYLFDIQFKLWHGRIATNVLPVLQKMNKIDDDKCEYCI